MVMELHRMAKEYTPFQDGIHAERSNPSHSNDMNVCLPETELRCVRTCGWLIIIELLSGGQ